MLNVPHFGTFETALALHEIGTQLSHHKHANQGTEEPQVEWHYNQVFHF